MNQIKLEDIQVEDSSDLANFLDIIQGKFNKYNVSSKWVEYWDEETWYDVDFCKKDSDDNTHRSSFSFDKYTGQLTNISIE